MNGLQNRTKEFLRFYTNHENHFQFYFYLHFLIILIFIFKRYSRDMFYWILYFSAFVPNELKQHLDQNNNQISYYDKINKKSFLSQMISECRNLFENLVNYIEVCLSGRTNLLKIYLNFRLKIFIKIFYYACVFGAIIDAYLIFLRWFNCFKMLIDSDNYFLNK